MALPLPDAVPSDLQTENRWCVFALGNDGRKRPYHARTLRAAGWDQNPVNFGVAVKALPKTFTDADGIKRKPSGLGVLIGGAVAGIDLDSCFYSKDGKRHIRAWAIPILRAAIEARCWVETSISRTGIHVVGRSVDGLTFDTKKVLIPVAADEPPAAPGEHEPQVDLFTSGYFTVSGQPIKGGSPATLGPIFEPWRLTCDLIESVRGGSPRVRNCDDDDPAPLRKHDPRDRRKRAPGGALDKLRLSSPMDMINDVAVQRLDAWFPVAFPQAEAQGGEWKLRAEVLGRDGSDNVSAKAGFGINDFWALRDPDEAREGARSPVDMLVREEYEPARAEDWHCSTPKEAAIKLALHLDLRWIANALRREPIAAGEVINIFTEVSQPIRSPQWPDGVLPVGMMMLASAHAARLRAYEHLLAFTMCVSMISAVPGRVLLDVFGDGKYRPGASLFAGILGSSGSGKSPAWSAALEPIYQAEREWVAQYQREKTAHERQQQRARKSAIVGAQHATPSKVSPQADDLDDRSATVTSYTDDRPASMVPASAPRRRRRMVLDVTTEALIGLMAEHDSGLILVQDEFTGFAGSLDRYSKSSRGGSADSAVYLSMYTGTPVGRDRVGSGDTFAARTHLSILTGVQPGILGPLIANLATDGLLQRFVWCIVPGLVNRARNLSPIDSQLSDTHAAAARILLNLRRDRDDEILLRAHPGAIECWSEFDLWCSGEGLQAARTEYDLPGVTAPGSHDGRIRCTPGVICHYLSGETGIQR